MCVDVVDKTVKELDVRNLVPAQREEIIFDHICELAFGASFMLINDNDPKPLLHQLETEYPGQFFSTSVETGPSAWRLEIGRREKAASRSPGR